MSRSSPTPAPIDFYASLTHYADHLLPIWEALEDDQRGWFYCEPRVAPALRAAGVAARVARPRGPRHLVVVAGGSDAALVKRYPVALVEHGAGQAYDVDDPGWSGGSGRDNAVLFLCPNEVSAGRNRASYPGVPAEVVGSPRVDALRSFAGTSPDGWGERTAEQPTMERQPSGPPSVVFSFHHMGNGKAPECGWALPHYEEALPEVVEELRTDGFEVLGHGHPRAIKRFARLWYSLNVEHLRTFGEVVSRGTIYACDNSSTLFEFAALGRPVVVLNAPWYRRDVDLWPRFWACADVGIQADDADELAPAVRLARLDLPEVAASRARAVAEVYPLLEGAAERSAHALLRAAASLQ